MDLDLIYHPVFWFELATVKRWQKWRWNFPWTVLLSLLIFRFQKLRQRNSQSNCTVWRCGKRAWKVVNANCFSGRTSITQVCLVHLHEQHFVHNLGHPTSVPTFSSQSNPPPNPLTSSFSLSLSLSLSFSLSLSLSFSFFLSPSLSLSLSRILSPSFSLSNFQYCLSFQLLFAIPGYKKEGNAIWNARERTR